MAGIKKNVCRFEEHDRIGIGQLKKEIILHLKEYDTAPLKYYLIKTILYSYNFLPTVAR